jgi:hypothetical protein
VVCDEEFGEQVVVSSINERFRVNRGKAGTKKGEIIMTPCLIFMILSFSFALAQQPKSVVIGEVTLTLGMQKNKVLEAIDSAHLKVVELKSDFYGILDKEFSIDDPVPQKIFGSVTFKRQRLSSVSREWVNSYDQEAIRLLRALISLVTSSMKEDVVSAKITKIEYDMPDGKTKGFMISLGGKSFNVSDLDFPSNKQHWVHIEEVLP